MERSEEDEEEEDGSREREKEGRKKERLAWRVKGFNEGLHGGGKRRGEATPTSRG